MKNNSDNMSANPRSIEGILMENPRIKIPIYQRDYSWKNDNWRELWNDIKIGFENNNKHYLGSIVLVKNGDVMEVVDGQQRLTTISILFLAIISNFNELIENGIEVNNNVRRAQDIKNLICKTDLYDISSTNKLQLNENNNYIYSDYLVEDKYKEIDFNSLSVSNRLLVECFIYFKKEIKKECTNSGEKYPSFKLLLDYYTYISKKLLLIEIIASDYQNAYVIFETLNDRGLDLTVTDLLKNYLFSMVNPKQHKNIKKYWNEVIKNVEEKNTTKFIRHYWNSYNKKVTEKELFKAIKEKMEKESDIIEFLKELNKASCIYAAFSDPSSKIWNGDEKIKKSLEEINLYKVDLCYPVLLAVEKHITDINLKRKIFRLCSIISFRYIVISNGGANDLERAYNELCIKINKEKNDINLEEIKKEMKEFIVSEEDFILRFKNKIIRSKRNKKLITYILKGIERNMGTNIIENCTIEHILPESYDETWNKIFDNEADEYVYRLGNYILLEKEPNSEIGNMNFLNKREKYVESLYSDAQSIGKLDKWTKVELERHQENMARIAQTVWSI